MEEVFQMSTRKKILRSFEEKKDYMNDRIAAGCVSMLADDLEKTGTFHEYYLPETGEPVHNPNFMSWNALAALMGNE